MNQTQLFSKLAAVGVTLGLSTTPLFSLDKAFAINIIPIEFKGTSEAGDFFGSYLLDQDAYLEAVLFGGTSTFGVGTDFNLFVGGNQLASDGTLGILKIGSGNSLNITFFFESSDPDSFLSIQQIDSPLSCITQTCMGVPSVPEGIVGELVFSIDDPNTRFSVTSYQQTPVPEPLTFLGAAMAVSFGAFFKRRLS